MDTFTRTSGRAARRTRTLPQQPKTEPEGEEGSQGTGQRRAGTHGRHPHTAALRQAEVLRATVLGHRVRQVAAYRSASGTLS